METLVTLLLNLMLIASAPELDVKIHAPSDCYNPRIGPMAYDVSAYCSAGGSDVLCVPFEGIPQAIVTALPASCLARRRA